ncbi:MAG: hypothetical protein KJ624_05225 [Chloroflexi bacterium]|nr:hypothetical protein [Chloroflexota bacterium]
MSFPSYLSELPLDTPLSWQVSHGGRECRGEVLLTSSWKPGLENLALGKDFGLIFLTRAQEVPPPPDPRLVVVVPAPARKQVKERSPREEARLYGLGRIIAQAPFTVTPEQVFSLEDNPRRFDLLARALLEHIEGRFPFLPQAERARRYLEGVELPEGEMALDRASLLEQLSPDYLLKSPHLWESIKALFDWLRSQYVPVYREHHRQYHQEISRMRARLEEKESWVMALGRLNSLSALGEPLGAGLAGEYLGLLEGLRPCPAVEVPLKEGPCCSLCHLGLLMTLPQGEVEAFLQGLQRALQGQLQRLSRRVIGRIMAQPSPRLERFIQAVQVSDLSGLAELLDEEVLVFIRGLLEE